MNGLVIFRFKLFSYWKEAVMVAVFCASVSTTIQYLDWISLITFVPPLFGILFFTLLSRIRWIYCLIMIVLGLTTSGLLEFGTVYLFHHFDIGLTLKILADDYTLESWYFVGPHMLICITLYQKRLGFTLLEAHRPPKVRDKTVILALFFLTANSAAGIFIAFRQSSILILALILFAGFIFFIVSNYIRELKADRH
ncbi:hypothetical protein LJK87_27555 [Paenibacillus sp. P25]|nr:hypothetical protein LJK87_27555 [Paenibacillus sp. P25]